MSDQPTVEQRQECMIRGLQKRVRSQAHALRIQNELIIERKAQLELLGIAWGTKGAATRANQLTADEVKRLVAMVDRIQRQHFNTEYRVMYESLDEYVRKIIEGRTKAWTDAHGRWYQTLRHAKRWKALAKKLRKSGRNAGAGKDGT